MFLQPFLAYTWKDSTTLTLNTESYYYWRSQEWSVPINLDISHIYHFGKMPVSLESAAAGIPKPLKTVPTGDFALSPPSFSPNKAEPQ